MTMNRRPHGQSQLPPSPGSLPWLPRVGALALLSLLLAACLASIGCAKVSLRNTPLREYARERQDDILSSGNWSIGARQAFVVLGLSADHCRRELDICAQRINDSPAINDEMRLSTLSELWLSGAIATSTADTVGQQLPDRTLEHYLQSARAAYAYLFFSARTSGDRAFEIRQAQVTQFYNYATRRVIGSVFASRNTAWPNERAGWSWLRPETSLIIGGSSALPTELIPADGLSFRGLRNVYGRDGLGATFVGSTRTMPAGPGGDAPSWSAPDYLPLTGLLSFPGSSLGEIVTTRQVRVVARDPLRERSFEFNGRQVPIAANYTAPYGIWLARSHFNRQSLLRLLGRGSTPSKPRVLMMQPFDPGKRTIVMIHGLASSPEAWINSANALLGYDEQLQSQYQIWQIYYATGLPLTVNRTEIQQALEATIAEFDPERRTRATQNMVLIGHSMGGVIARLLVSSSQGELLGAVPIRDDYPAEDRKMLVLELDPYLSFEPMPEVTRAIFLAAPHRGSPKAEMTIAHLLKHLIRLPGDVMRQNANLIRSMRSAAPPGSPTKALNSIDALSNKNLFLRVAAELPIASSVRYHSIIGTYRRNQLPIEESTDGVVPYWSSHLPGAASELIVDSWHDVQEKVEAMQEIQRILHHHLEDNP